MSYNYEEYDKDLEQAKKDLEKIQKLLQNQPLPSNIKKDPYSLDDKILGCRIYILNSVAIDTYFKKAKNECTLIEQPIADTIQIDLPKDIEDPKPGINRIIDNLKKNLEETIELLAEIDQPKTKIEDIVQKNRIINQLNFDMHKQNGIVFVNRIENKKIKNNVYDVIYYEKGIVAGVISAIPKASLENSRVYDIINKFEKIKGPNTARYLTEPGNQSISPVLGG